MSRLRGLQAEACDGPRVAAGFGLCRGLNAHWHSALWVYADPTLERAFQLYRSTWLTPQADTAAFRFFALASLMIMCKTFMAQGPWQACLFRVAPGALRLTGAMLALRLARAGLARARNWVALCASLLEALLIGAPHGRCDPTP